MINQNMDSRVTELQESVELKEKLNAFKDKLETETVTEADVDDLIQEFQTLQDAAALYKESGNEAIRNQIVYWLDCWKDTTDAAIAYLNGVKSSLNGDVSAVVEYNTEGETAFAQSKTHDFLYVNYQEVAEVVGLFHADLGRADEHLAQTCEGVTQIGTGFLPFLLDVFVIHCERLLSDL